MFLQNLHWFTAVHHMLNYYSDVPQHWCLQRRVQNFTQVRSSENKKSRKKERKDGTYWEPVGLDVSQTTPCSLHPTHCIMHGTSSGHDPAAVHCGSERVLQTGKSRALCREQDEDWDAAGRVFSCTGHYFPLLLFLFFFSSLSSHFLLIIYTLIPRSQWGERRVFYSPLLCALY